VTGIAAAYTAFPGCVAVIVHVPGAFRKTVPPESWQTEAAAALKLTGRPELAVALIVN
jgi:hypothetical protein